MSDIKFSCPICSQHISCDAQWSGLQIKCPGCENDIVVPEAQAQPAPVTAPSGRLRINLPVPSASQGAPAEEPPIPRPIPPQAAPKPAYRPLLANADNEGGSMKGRIIALVVVLILLPAVWFIFSWAGSAQKKFNIAREGDREDSGGGQLGHIAELNAVLDATDPAKHSRYNDDEPRGATPIPMETEKLNPPQWTPDVAAARIPPGKANGTISGEPFIADRAFLQRSQTGYILTVRQGEGFQADREVMIYLTLKAGQKLDGNSWNVGKADTAGVPRVAKRWMAGGKPQTKFFQTNYVMKLEFGQSTEGDLPARLYLALPDEEKTVVGGSIDATFLVAGSAQPMPVRRTIDVGDY